MVIPREGLFYTNTMILSETEKNYIAGFLEGDGCINACTNHQTLTTSLSSNRVYIGFYQKTTNHWFLLWLQKKCRYGFVRKRKDGMSEYIITGPDPDRIS